MVQQVGARQLLERGPHGVVAQLRGPGAVVAPQLQAGLRVDALTRVPGRGRDRRGVGEQLADQPRTARQAGLEEHADLALGHRALADVEARAGDRADDREAAAALDQVPAAPLGERGPVGAVAGQRPAVADPQVGEREARGGRERGAQQEPGQQPGERGAARGGDAGAGEVVQGGGEHGRRVPRRLAPPQITGSRMGPTCPWRQTRTACPSGQAASRRGHALRPGSGPVLSSPKLGVGTSKASASEIKRLASGVWSGTLR